MRTSEEVGRAHARHSEKCNCGEALFKSLPAFVTAKLTCRCQRDYRENVTRYSSVGIPSIGDFCNLCGKPTRFNIAWHYYTCEACDKFFTYDFRKFNNPPEWPPPNLLCQECDNGLPPAPRRRGIVFH